MTKKTGPLNNALHEAQRSLNGTQGLVAQFKEELEQLRANDKELSARINEALIAEEMGTAPADDVASLRRERLELADAIERQGARVTAFQRRLEEQDSAQCMAASETLRLATVSWVEDRGKQIRERWNQILLDAQGVQRDAIALTRLLGRLNIKGLLQRDLDLSDMVHAEVVSLRGVPKDWPAMGDRKTGNELIAPQMAGLRADLEAL